MSHFTTATKVMIGLLLFSLWSTTTAKARLISKELQLPRENLVCYTLKIFHFQY
jgi:hypothetical protein